MLDGSPRWDDELDGFCVEGFSSIFAKLTVFPAAAIEEAAGKTGMSRDEMAAILGKIDIGKVSEIARRDRPHEEPLIVKPGEI